ncbi:Melanopsin, partial [Cichlidogyrus casuarinus]
FPAIDPIYHYVFGTLIGIIGLAAVVANLIVILVFTSSKKLRTLPTIFILNLAISDLTFSLICALLLKTISMFNTRWAFSADLCIFYGLLGSVTGFVSLETNAMIAIERLMIIARPLGNLGKIDKYHRYLMVLLTWILAIAWSVPPLLGYGRIVLEGFHTHCSMDFISKDFGTKVYMTVILGFGFCSNILIIGYCYTNVSLFLRRHEKEMCAFDRRRANYNRTELRATKVAFMCFAGFLFSWLPYAMTALLAILGKHEALTPFILEFPSLFTKTSALYNPIIYAISHPKFRKRLCKIVPF